MGGLFPPPPSLLGCFVNGTTCGFGAGFGLTGFLDILSVLNGRGELKDSEISSLIILPFSFVHSVIHYIEGNCHTNNIEGFWSNLKRGINGIYHQVSEKHLERYLDEYANRYNTRKLTSQERFELFLGQSESVLSYKDLTTRQ